MPVWEGRGCQEWTKGHQVTGLFSFCWELLHPHSLPLLRNSELRLFLFHLYFETLGILSLPQDQLPAEQIL